MKMKTSLINFQFKNSVLLGITLSGLLSSAVNAEIKPLPDRCADMIGLPVETGVVTAAHRVSTGDSISKGDIFGGVPVDAATDFCRVSLLLEPTSSSEIKADIWLPDTWNEKLFGYGGGGFSGGLGHSEAVMNEGVARGYVAATSDLGHVTGAYVDWAYNEPEKVIDFGHRGNHLLAVTSKQLIQAYYGTPASRAYFQGCSGGGREALMNVSRYPQDYDGVIAGAPPMNWGELMSQQIWRGQVAFWAPKLLFKLNAINKAVMNKCDTLDGVKDGRLENPLQCNFDPAEMQCASFATNSCLTRAEVNALRKIYTGPKLKNGELLMPGLAVGSEGITWFAAALTDLVGGPQYYKWMVFNDPNWSALTFNLDRDYSVSQILVQPIINADNPDLREFAQYGGKLIVYHGWNDAIVPGPNSVRYFEAVSEVLGSKTQDTVRLFMMPGQQHCTGSFDMVQHLEDWVERGLAPDRVIVSDGASSHPSCPWPQTAHYNGSGETTDAANFTCR